MASRIWLGLGLAISVAGVALAAPAAVDGAVEARLRALEKRVSELEQRAAPEDLERRVSALEHRIGNGGTPPAAAPDHTLEQRVTTLEQKGAAPVAAGAATTAPTVPAAPARWADPKNWAALRVGMSWSQVKQLLGVPGKVKAGVFGDVMYFPDDNGGSVEFDRDGRVAKWSRSGH